MTKKKETLTKAEENDLTWGKIKKLEDQIRTLKDELHPAELAPQATLAQCNAINRKIK